MKAKKTMIVFIPGRATDAYFKWVSDAFRDSKSLKRKYEIAILDGADYTRIEIY